MSLRHRLAALGFSRAATLVRDGDGQFGFVAVDPAAWRRVAPVIYAYVDPESGRFLNIGQTGTSLKARFDDYARWLNGKRKRENHGPVRMRWLSTLRQCRSGQVEVWTKRTSRSERTRLSVERTLIERLAPILNVPR